MQPMVRKQEMPWGWKSPCLWPYSRESSRYYSQVEKWLSFVHWINICRAFVAGVRGCQGPASKGLELRVQSAQEHQPHGTPGLSWYLRGASKLPLRFQRQEKFKAGSIRKRPLLTAWKKQEVAIDWTRPSPEQQGKYECAQSPVGLQAAPHFPIFCTTSVSPVSYLTAAGARLSC